MTDTQPQYHPLGRSRDFLLLMLGHTGSLVGSSMTSLALVMLAYAITDSAAKAGLVSAAYGISMALMMLPAGVIVDRVDRKLAMVVSAGVGAAILISIPLAGLWSVQFPHLLVVAFLVGALSCFYNPAELAALKEIVPPSQMSTAMATNQGRGSFASLTGPPLAGVMYEIGRTIPFLIDALTYLLAATCAALVRQPLPAPRRPRQQTLIRDMTEGIAWLGRARALRDLVIASMVSNIAFTGVVITVLLTLQQGGTLPSQLGLLQASYGFAGIIGSLLATIVVRLVPVGSTVRIVYWLLVCLYMLLTFGASIWWMGALVATGYLLVGSSNTAMSSYQLHITPSGMLGRSEAAASFGRVVMIPFGSAAAGLLLEGFGHEKTLLVFAIVMASAAAIATLSRPIGSTPRVADLPSIGQAA